MKRFFGLMFLIGWLNTVALAQTSPNGDFVVFTCGKDTVYSSEFWRIFNKNNNAKTKATQAELEEYLELYIKFKLKVNEAYSRGMDTNRLFLNELNGYRKQLAQPYLTDNTVTDKLIQEAYERSKYIIKASHIMVALDPAASPADTLRAWQKITRYHELLKNGADFDSLAYEVSEDPSAKGQPGNRGFKGDLGYFTAFQMVYPFETAAYQIAPGQFSEPVRTSFGYHLLKVYDRKSNPGDIKVAHIMIRFNNEEEVSTAKEKMDAIYKKAKDGVAFEELVEQYTEDFSTRNRGGQLNWFGFTTDNIPQAFREAAFQLNADGQLSVPVKSEFGWHLIKRIELKPMAELDEMKETLKAKIARDSRSRINKEAVLERIKKENQFTETKGSYQAFSTFVDGSITTGNWKKPTGFDSSRTLFSIAGKSYLFGDFADYILRTQSKRNGSEQAILKEMYQEYVEKSNFDYEESILERKYPEFKYLMQEYRDGILLFELTDKEVWSKSVQDTLGLEAFYNENKGKYLWKDRADAEIYICSSAKVAAQVSKMLKKGNDRSAVLAQANKKDPLAVKSEAGLFESGKNDYLNLAEWKTGIQQLESQGKQVVIKITELRPSEPKKMSEAMGLITSDYQNALEKQWIEELREKFPLQINPMAIPELMKL